MKATYFLLFILSVFFSCRDTSKLSISQDFEHVAGWFDSSALVHGKGHSGMYYTFAGPGQEYSQGFSSKLGDISKKTVRRIDMGAWVRISDTRAKARLVLSIQAGDSSVFWQAIDTEGASLKPGTWSRLYFTYDLPKEFPADYVVKMFLWNVSGKVVDADDFDLYFYFK